MAKCRECTYCGASLDFGEKCDCGGLPRIETVPLPEPPPEPRTLTPLEIKAMLFP